MLMVKFQVLWTREKNFQHNLNTKKCWLNKWVPYGHISTAEWWERRGCRSPSVHGRGNLVGKALCNHEDIWGFLHPSSSDQFEILELFGVLEKHSILIELGDRQTQ